MGKFQGPDPTAEDPTVRRQPDTTGANRRHATQTKTTDERAAVVSRVQQRLVHYTGWKRTKIRYQTARMTEGKASGEAAELLGPA